MIEPRKTRTVKVNNLFFSVKNALKNCSLSSLLNYAGALLISSMVIGCGGGGSSKATTPTSTTFTGTAAIGAAITNASVTAICSTGTGTATTNSNGAYSMTLSSSTAALPCLLKVTSGATTLYSAVYSGQSTANITPITHLIVSNALGADPSTAASPLSSSLSSKLTSTNISNSSAIIKAALTQVGITLPSGIDPVAGQFVAATAALPGDSLDACIDALMNALANTTPATTLSALATNLQTKTTTTTAASFMATTTISTSTLPAQLSLYSTTNYSMQSLPINGLVTYHSASEIIYASDTYGYLILFGNFVYTGTASTDAATEVLANLSGTTGTINAIAQYDTHPNPVMSITQLNISEATVEGYIEAGNYHGIWQLFTSSPDLQVSVAGTAITCPTPGTGTANSTTTSSANQSIKTFFANSCPQ